MANPLSKRILKEIKDGMSSKIFYFFYDQNGEYGEANCCYVKWNFSDKYHKDETHILRFDFLNLGEGKMFPKNPPVVRFITPMSAPFVFEDGTICLDILGHKYHEHDKNFDGWSPMMNVSTIFNSIIALITQDNITGFTLVKNYYANKMKTDAYSKIKKMVEMKFSNE
jgi:ubiquitin-protein ligase